MKTIPYLLLLFVILISSVGNAQQSSGGIQKVPTICEPYISMGYWNAPSHLNGYLAAVLDYFGAKGVPITAQTEFAKTFCIDGGILISRLNTIQVGLSLSYRYTPASAEYKGDMGTLNIDGSLNAADIALVVRARVARFGDYPLYFTFEPGVSYTEAEIMEHLRSATMWPNYANLRWGAYDWGVRLRATLGTSFPLGPFNAGVQVGYQVNFTTVTNAEADQGWVISHSDETGLDQDAVIFLVRVGYVF